MKTKLLYVTSFLLVFFTSCSVEETIAELPEQEKELKTKSFIKAFIEDVKPSQSFVKFMENVKFKSSSGSTQEEINELEQFFLSQQSADFVELYYYVAALNLSEEELKVVIIDYFSNVIEKVTDKVNKDSEDCVAAGNENSGSLWQTILTIVCELTKSIDD